MQSNTKPYEPFNQTIQNSFNNLNKNPTTFNKNRKNLKTINIHEQKHEKQH